MLTYLRYSLLQFLTKHPGHRLGCHPQKGQAEIRNHAFFRTLDWEKLANKELKPPFKPKSVGLHVCVVCGGGRKGRGGLWCLCGVHAVLSRSTLQKGDKLTSNFDEEFTRAPPILSEVDKQVVDAIDPELFADFSFTNPDMYKVPKAKNGV